MDSRSERSWLRHGTEHLRVGCSMASIASYYRFKPGAEHDIYFIFIFRGITITDLL